MVLLLFFAVLVLMVVWLVEPSRLVRWMRQDREQAPTPTVSRPVPPPRTPPARPQRRSS